ncbi:hypothetical protein AEQ67_13335 [Pseudomonas sp. RIT-PI-q]|nr:hypothetical protein AEQ67_13335 [Pseudomonas sp. RIT-PI-q]
MRQLALSRFSAFAVFNSVLDVAQVPTNRVQWKRVSTFVGAILNRVFEEIDVLLKFGGVVVWARAQIKRYGAQRGNYAGLK